MLKDYAKELETRVEFIKGCLQSAGASGVVFGNSGGKDSALVGILCKKACDNTLGVMLPCQSRRNFDEDMKDGIAVAKQFSIENITVDLSDVKAVISDKISLQTDISPMAGANIAPRLRMTALYTIAQSRNALVAGTGNRSEAYVGYFTKWGDGAHDFNPIADLTVTEIYEFLAFLGAPESIITKAPSAGLFEGQTDESEMGITYAAIDEYLLNGTGDKQTIEKIEGMHERSEHKRQLPLRI